jgi:hypothetical protein
MENIYAPCHRHPIFSKIKVFTLLATTNLLQEFFLQPEVEDTHFWRLSPTGQYSAKSAYEGLFLGATNFSPWDRIWKTWAPLKCRFFMWLVAHKRCWTADWLARHGLPHLECCPLCDQADESIDHLLVACVFTRQFWFYMFQKVGLLGLSPGVNEQSFYDWWEGTDMAATGLLKKGIIILIIFGSWTIWNHRNRCVFEKEAPSLIRALVMAREERKLWVLAVAKGLNLLAAPLLDH